MSVPFMTAALALADLVPMMAKWFSKDGPQNGSSEMIASQVVELAKKLQGKPTP